MNRPVAELLQVVTEGEFNGWRAYGNIRRELKS